MTSVDAGGTRIAAPALTAPFPGRVNGPDGQAWRQVRPIVTEDALVVYGVRDGQAATILVVEVVSHRPGGSWVVIDEWGGEWTVTGDGGCGCGSPLRSLPSPPPVYLDAVAGDVTYAGPPPQAAAPPVL